MSVDDQVADLLVRWEEAWEHGDDLPAAELCAEAPELVGAVQAKIEALKGMQWVKAVVATNQHQDGEDAAGPGDLPLPYVLGGRYRIESLIAEGGFGSVYQGYDPELERPVAVKIPHRWRACSSLPGEALIEEARRAARLRHPNIVGVHDIGREDGMHFIVSDLIKGPSLADLITGKRPSPQDAVKIVTAVADALHFAHEQGFVHRDVKPANILIDSSRQPHVTDFGIATTKADLENGHGATAGTLAYMAPEQVAGEIQLIDARTDIYALGVVLYELLTGSLPYPARTPTALREQILFRPPVPLRGQVATVSKDLARLCMRCLSKHPADRPATARELAEALRRVRPTPPLRISGLGIFPIAVAGIAMAVAVMIFWPSRPAEQDGLPKVAYAEEKTLSFDGYTRIVTPVERFAPVTLEAWIEPASYDLTLPRYIIGSSIPNQHGIGLAQAGYHLAAGIIPGWFHSQAAIPRHRWSHVAGTFADGKSVLYLNGEEVARGPGTLDEGGTPFVIGNIGLKRTDALFFHGRMRSVRISKGVRFKESFIPDQQFRPDPPDSPTPAVLIYDGSKTEDGRIEDHSRIGNHGDVQTFSLAAE